MEGFSPVLFLKFISAGLLTFIFYYSPFTMIWAFYVLLNSFPRLTHYLTSKLPLFRGGLLCTPFSTKFLTRFAGAAMTKHHRPGCLREIYFSQFWELRSPWSSCQQDRFHLRLLLFIFSSFHLYHVMFLCGYREKEKLLLLIRTLILQSLLTLTISLDNPSPNN